MAKRERIAKERIGPGPGSSSETDGATRSRLGTIAGHPIVATVVDGAVVSIDFEEPSAQTPLDSPPPWLAEPFARYLAGESETFESLPIRPRGTPFQLRVWAELRAIPWGHVASYAQIAERVNVPRGMRAVGAANGANPIPIVVPCHRVVEGSGKLGGYSGGLDVKRALLAREGARFVGDRVHVGQLALFSESR